MAYTTDSLQFLERATETLRAAAHPIRLSIIGLLAEEGPRTVKHIHESLDIQQPVASHHLRIMKDKGIVDVERDGQNSRYGLRDKRFAGLLEIMRELI
ncbi:helix-turn-helix transcriptional regulator [Lewinella sp. W8]|uniref:ArsR/SmtB family transcription factor n=1 Tax=Lewinella sp. W8 TaxID=2528208 RepID=UPI0010672000|nr:metalloregulator ArsR/SmtB family transcription factor [Lewinella sp. W8]MTB49898.1 metalloregulator ArsR/SmtB family transcription factor [Lewinella sp. W8]